MVVETKQPKNKDRRRGAGECSRFDYDRLSKTTNEVLKDPKRPHEFIEEEVLQDWLSARLNSCSCRRKGSARLAFCKT